MTAENFNRESMTPTQKTRALKNELNQSRPDVPYCLWLIDNGANLYKKDHLLISAAFRGYAEIVEALLDKKFSLLDERDSGNARARDYAFANGHHNIVKIIDAAPEKHRQKSAARKRDKKMKAQLARIDQAAHAGPKETRTAPALPAFTKKPFPGAKHGG